MKVDTGRTTAIVASRRGVKFDHALDHDMQEIRRRAVVDQGDTGRKRLVLARPHRRAQGGIGHALEQLQTADIPVDGFKH